MKELCSKGNSVLFSSHILDVVEKVCNKVSIIRNGTLVYSGLISKMLGEKDLEEVFMEISNDEKLLILIRNGFMQFSRINQLKYADARTRRKIIFTYIVVFAALVGLLIYWSRALNTIFSLQWIAEDVIIYLVTPMVLISTIINVFIGVFGVAVYYFLILMLKLC